MDELRDAGPPARLQHVDRSKHVQAGIKKWVPDTHPHIDLRRQMQHRIRANAPHHIHHFRRGDIDLLERKPDITGGLGQVLKASGGQIVDSDDVVAISQHTVRNRGADKTSRARDKNTHGTTA